MWHLIEHLGINETNYFMYRRVGPVRSHWWLYAEPHPPHPSELLHLNQAGGAGLDRMVLLKGGRTEKGCNTTIEATGYRGITNHEIRSPERHLADTEANSLRLSFCIQRVVIQMGETCCYCTCLLLSRLEVSVPILPFPFHFIL